MSARRLNDRHGDRDREQCSEALSANTATKLARNQRGNWNRSGECEPLCEIQYEISSRQQAKVQQEVLSAGANPYLPLDVRREWSERMVLNPLVHTRHMIRRRIDVPRRNCDCEDECDREYGGDEGELKSAANWLETFAHTVPGHRVGALTPAPDEIARNRDRPDDGKRNSTDCVERAQDFGDDDEAETEERDLI